VISVYTRVSNPPDATASLRSGVTEVAFYTMPNRPSSSEQTEMEGDFTTVIREVQEIGKATGAAVGWSECHLPLVVAVT